MVDINCLGYDEISLISEVEALSNVLGLATRLTGMRFAAISHFTEAHWIACAVHDELHFGISVGDVLDIEKTLCGELRIRKCPIIIGDVSDDTFFLERNASKLYGFKSFVSLPIVFLDGNIFGSLCMLDYLPKKLDEPWRVDMLNGIVRLFSIALESRYRVTSR